jgi:hypothetical protein
MVFHRMDAKPDFTAAPDFQHALSMVPARMREDALQEAWVAHLSGDDPILALDAYRKREARHERRQPGRIVTREGGTFAVDKRGNETEI